MKRLPAPLLAVLVVLMAVPVLASEHFDDPLEPIFAFFGAQENQVFVARFLREPVAGRGSTTDPEGDFEHSTGQEPGYTPDHIDILSTSAAQFDPEPLELFPSTGNGIWAETGPNHVEPPDNVPFHTFTGDTPHDGSQYDRGTYLFGFTVAAPPPIEVQGRCEYVVWVNDLSRGPTFVNHPNFPGDPAGGTNLAFGLGINPEGQAASSTFTLELSKTSGFAPNPETDVRSFISRDYVGITVPKDAIGQLAGVNFYTFCAESGFGLDPAESGADQTGLIEMTDDDAAIIEVVALPAVVAATTTTVQRTTSTLGPHGSEITSTETEKPAEDDAASPWWLALIGVLALSLLGYWLLAGRGDVCRELATAWKAARKECAAADKAVTDATKMLEKAEVDLKDLEDERAAICRNWPPACWDSKDGDWVEDAQGNRMTARDVHMRKMALGEVWGDYKAGKLSATQVEAKWKKMDTPEFREELAETDQAFEDSLERIDNKISIAREFLDEALNMALQAQRNADDACAMAARARDAYDDCVSRKTAAANQT
jgi:hypothetical protein